MSSQKESKKVDLFERRNTFDRMRPRDHIMYNLSETRNMKRKDWTQRQSRNQAALQTAPVNNGKRSRFMSSNIVAKAVKLIKSKY